MTKQLILQDIANAEAKIIATRASLVFSEDYKSSTIFELGLFVSHQRDQLADYDRLMKTSS